MNIIKQKLSINGLILRYYEYSNGIPINYVKKVSQKNIKKYNEKLIKDSVNRTKKSVSDLLECNEDMDKFVTLTFAIEPKTIDLAYYYFKNFIKRLNYYYGKNIKYVAVPEYGKKGRLHLHFVSNMDYIDSNKLADIWGKGFIKIKKIKYGTLIHYVIKYINKEIVLRKNKRRYYYSNNLDRPYVIKGFNALIAYNFFTNYLQLTGSYNYYSKYCGEVKLKTYRVNTKNIVEFVEDLVYKLANPPNFYNSYNSLPKNMQLSLL